jgi:hypothetical protein
VKTNPYRRTELSVLVVSFLLAFVCIDHIVYAVPKLSERSAGRSIKAQCASIQPGMSLAQVVEAFRRENIPMEQSFTPRDAVFGTTTASCRVEFGNDGLVSRVEVRRPLWEY